MTWETVIGLETHAELATRTKIFCSCTTRFGGEPNTHCCPICTGMPGTLPMVNRKVVEYACRAGLALNCEITRAAPSPGTAGSTGKTTSIPTCPRRTKCPSSTSPLPGTGV